MGHDSLIAVEALRGPAAHLLILAVAAAVGGLAYLVYLAKRRKQSDHGPASDQNSDANDWKAE